MPGTIQEQMTFVRALLDEEIMPDTVPVWADGTTPDEEEERTLNALVRYEWRCRMDRRLTELQRPAQRKAMRCLRRFLSGTQRRQLARSRCFDVTAPSGRVYRFWPAEAMVEELERHGKRLYRIASFCIHPDLKHGLPPADVTLSQLLLLSTDEAEFLATANARNRRSQQLWNGDWARQLRRAREARAREREAAAA